MNTGQSVEWKRYDASMESYDEIRDDIMNNARAVNMAPEQLLKLELGIEEIISNIISYTYDDGGYLWIKTSASKAYFQLDIADHGKPFNPLARDMRPTEGVPSTDQEEGGYGIFLVKKLFFGLEYRHEILFEKPANHFTMKLLLA